MFKPFQRWGAALAGAASLCAAMWAAPAMAQTTPIKVGGSLALTGPLSASAVMQKIAGEIYLEQLNKRGGWMGRPVEWVLKDDQSKPDVARTLYEQLVTVDKVDLLMGPYATANSLAAMGVAQRYSKFIITNSFGVPSLAKYEMHFPAYAMGHEPGTTSPTTLLDAFAANGIKPQTVALVTSKFPSVSFMSVGARDVFRKRGMRELLWLEWEFGNRDFGSIAARIKDANPDFLWVGSIGPESIQLLEALSKIDYRPKLHFHLYPTPGPMSQSPLGANALSFTTFEQHAPFTSNPAYADVFKTFNDRAAKANLPDTAFELQAANCFAGWQVLEAGVKGTNSLDDKRIAEIRELYGFDKPPHERFWQMLGQFARFDLGKSFYQHKDVWQLVKEKLPVSISLGLWTFFLSYLIAVPLGVAKAVRAGSRFDLVTTLVVLVGYAIPGFVLGVALLVVFGANWCGDCKVLDTSFKQGRVATLVNDRFTAAMTSAGLYEALREKWLRQSAFMPYASLSHLVRSPL